MARSTIDDESMNPSDFVIGMRLILAAQHSYSISRAANRRPKSKVDR